MRFFLVATSFLLVITFGANPQTTTQEQVDLDTLQADRLITEPNIPFDSVANSDDMSALYINPAGLGVHPLQFGYFYGHNEDNDIQDHTVFLNLLGIAFSGQWRFAPSTLDAQRYTIGTSLGNSRVFSVGTSFSWFDSDIGSLDQFTSWDVGFLFRPYHLISLGVVGRALNKPILDKEEFQPRWDIGIAVRPPFIKSERFTFAIDTTWNNKDTFTDLLPRYSVEVVPFSGVTVYGGWNNFSDVFFGMKFAQNISQISFQANVPKQQGTFFSGGVLFGQERFKTRGEAIRSFLILELDQAFDEQKKSGSLFISENLTLYEMLQAIDIAKDDSQIQGIIIKGRTFRGGWGQAEELRSSLLAFQNESNKPVYAYLEAASNKEYYIASMAKSISMPQASTLMLNGLKSEMFFIKGLFDKVGIEADFVAMGNYKSAPETFTRKEPSPYSEEQVKDILTSLHSELTRSILHTRRNLNKEGLEMALHEGFLSANKAQKKGLIDKVEYFADMRDELLKDKISEIFWKVDLPTYVKTRFYDDTWGPKPVLAVIVMEGDIISGTSQPAGLFSSSSIGSDTLVDVLKRVRENSAVEGVVIRINSPGGSGLASDIIWNEIRRLKEKKKFVTISLGNVAASGGYYLAVGADEIVANHSTITGSIGVFAGKFSLKGLYSLLGVNKAVYTTHSKGAIFSEADKFSPEERKLLEEHIAEFYELFIQRVARSRTSLTKEQIEENAQGRVYTGAAAKKRGMVDHIGGLMLAIELTRVKAGLSKDAMEIKVYPNEAQGLFNLGDPGRLAIPMAVREAMKVLNKTERLQDDQIYFMMPYELDVK